KSLFVLMVLTGPNWVASMLMVRPANGQISLPNYQVLREQLTCSLPSRGRKAIFSRLMRGNLSPLVKSRTRNLTRIPNLSRTRNARLVLRDANQRMGHHKNRAITRAQEMRRTPMAARLTAARKLRNYLAPVASYVRCFP